MNRPVQLVLDSRKVGVTDRPRRVVVHAGGAADVGGLLVEPPLRRADVPNPLEQLIEVVRAKRAPVLQTLVVEGPSR